MVQNCTIDLTQNNKSKPSDSQALDDNSQTIANNSNNKKYKIFTPLHVSTLQRTRNP